jgi:oligopeptide transport system permease protein
MKKIFFFSAALFLSVLILATVFYPLLGHDALRQNIEQILQSPSATHWFGTDSLGRDVLARVLLGARISLFVGIVCAIISGIFGFFYGAVAGWNDGWVDRVLMRICDILMALPSFILVAVLCLTLNLLLPMEEGLFKAMISLCIGICATHWMGMARVSRGMVQEILRKPYIEAAEALGATPWRILREHVLPNMLSTLLVMMALQVPLNIVYESFMSFIGLGIHPPYTSWGILVREGWKTLSSFPHLILFPSMILFFTVWSIHILVDKFKKII